MYKEILKIWFFISWLTLGTRCEADMPFQVKQAVYTYSESSEYLDNPDRGIYVQIPTHEPQRMEEYARLKGAENIRILLLVYDLSAYTGSETIKEAKLQELEKAFAEAERLHYSVVFRAAYGFSSGKRKEPEDISMVLSHIEQMCGVLREHEDSLLCVQAGMLGPYGEWHSSRYTANGEYTAEAHQVVMAWQENLPGTTAIALRRPSFVQEAVLAGADAARLTVHNDALLSNDTDMDTFRIDQSTDRAQNLQYIGSLTPVWMGGEMVGVSDYTQIENAVSEFETMGISYLNRYYNQKVWNSWRKQEYGGMRGDQYIVNHLGYRLVLREVSCESLREYQRIVLRMENVGFGRLDPRVQFYLRTEKDGETEFFELKRSGDEKSLELSYCFLEENCDADGIGIVITRDDIGNLDERNTIRLANQEVEFQGGVNYLRDVLFP